MSKDRPLPTSTGRIPYLDSLRVLASFFVMWNHFSEHVALAFESSLIRTIIDIPYVLHGKMVLLFFVITGLVYSIVLSKKRNSPMRLSRFALGRILRLWIPSAVVVILTTVMYWILFPKDISPGPQVLSLGGFFTNLFLLADLSPYYTWDTETVILWNISIQIQFILLAVLMTPLFSITSGAGLSALLALSFVGLWTIERGWIFNCLPFFTAGIAMYKMGSDEKRTGLVFYLLSIAGVWFFWDLKTCAILLIPLVAKFVPLFHGPFWSGLAKVSFSLYLTHFLVGQRVLNFGRPYADSDTGKVALFGAALLISFGIAYVFYRVIEQPSHRLARKIAQA